MTDTYHYLNDLTICWDDFSGVWLAFSGDTPDDSRWLGEGSSKVEAAEDYWWQRNKGDEVFLSQNDNGDWELELSRGVSVIFGSPADAFSYAIAKDLRVTTYRP
jgi:hypothetical protein